jgi:hypothetical protein
MNKGSSYMNTFSRMIERMEDYILTGVGVPFTPFTMVNGERLLPLLDRIRENMPDEIQQAQQVLAQKDALLNDAQTRAEQMVEMAKKHAEELLSESELLRAVHEEAYRVREQIVTELDAMRKKAFEEAEFVRSQALEESHAIREGSDQYAEAILGSLRRNLDEFQTVIRNGQQHLKKARESSRRLNPHRHSLPITNPNQSAPVENMEIRSSLDELYAKDLAK